MISIIKQFKRKNILYNPKNIVEHIRKLLFFQSIIMIYNKKSCKFNHFLRETIFSITVFKTSSADK